MAGRVKPADAVHLMPVIKRMFDIGMALLLIAFLTGPMAILLLWLLVAQGRPIFFVSERMKTPNRAFGLWKLRSMTEATNDQGVTGGDKQNRLTQCGRWLRRSRLDEVPQLWNILRGDMSFVGPRPPLRVYVERFPELYADVLQSRPGVTGLASILCHRAEERRLQQCQTAAETDAVYARVFVLRKAKLDLIYQRHWTLCFDLCLLWRTVSALGLASFR